MSMLWTCEGLSWFRIICECDGKDDSQNKRKGAKVGAQLWMVQGSWEAAKMVASCCFSMHRLLEHSMYSEHSQMGIFKTTNMLCLLMDITANAFGNGCTLKTLLLVYTYRWSRYSTNETHTVIVPWYFGLIRSSSKNMSSSGSIKQSVSSFHFNMETGGVCQYMLFYTASGTQRDTNNTASIFREAKY